MIKCLGEVEGRCVKEKKMKNIHKKAKAYKKFGEKIAIYPYPFEIDGENYYFVDYILMRKPMGSAVISIGEENDKKAREAYHHLYSFYGYSGILENEALARLQVDLNYLREPLEKMDAHSQVNWGKGYEFIRFMLDYQLLFKSIYHEFVEHINSHQIKQDHPLTKVEIDLAHETAAKLEAIKYHVMLELSENIDELKKWKKEMQKSGLWDKLKRHTENFYNQLIRSEDVTKEEAKKAKSKDFEKAVELTKAKLERQLKNKLREDMATIRFPHHSS